MTTSSAPVSFESSAWAYLFGYDSVAWPFEWPKHKQQYTLVRVL